MRRLLVDASVFITLTEIDRVDLLAAFEGTATVPSAVADEIRTEPAASVLEDAVSEGWLRRGPVETDTALERDGEWTEPTRKAAAHLGTDDSTDDWHGDVALLARALKTDGESSSLPTTNRFERRVRRSEFPSPVRSVS